MRSSLSHKREDSEINGSWLWLVIQRFGYEPSSSFSLVDCSQSKHHIQFFKCPMGKGTISSRPFLRNLDHFPRSPQHTSPLISWARTEPPACSYLLTKRWEHHSWLRLTVVCPGEGPGSLKHLSYLHHWRKLGFSEEGREGERAVREAANSVILKGNVPKN